MRILRVIATVDPATGGPVAGLRAVTPVLAQLGHETEFLTLDAAADGFLQSWGGPVHALGPVQNRYAYSPRVRPWLAKNLRRYDAVVVHGLWQDLGRAVRAACRVPGAPPYFVFPHGMLDPSLRKTYPILHVKKWIYWQLVERHVLREARAVLFTCEEERRLARTTFAHYECTEEVITYGAATPDTPHAMSATSWEARCPALIGRRYLLFLGRIHSKKGADLLLRAYGHVRRAAQDHQRSTMPDLVIAGPCLDETYLAALKKQAENEGIGSNVHWPGMLTGETKWGALRGCDAFVLPSHQENFGIAVVEALACGRPVLISNRVNIWSELSGDGAALVDADTVEGATRLLQRWLALSESQTSAMAAAAAQSFQKRFEITRAATRFAEQLSALVNRSAITA